MDIKPLPPGETVGGQGRAYWVEKYFQWLFPLIYEKEEEQVNVNDQQHGLVWFARGKYTRGFEGFKDPVNETYELPFNTYFMVPMLKFIAHEEYNDGSNYGQLLNVVRSLADWSPMHSLGIWWSEEKNKVEWFRCTRQSDGSFEVEGDYSPIEYYAETQQFYLSTKGYEQPSTKAVAAGYYVIFKFDQKPGKEYKIRVHADFDYHWAQRHERMDVTDTYTIKIVGNHTPRYTDGLHNYQDKVKHISFP